MTKLRIEKIAQEWLEVRNNIKQLDTRKDELEETLMAFLEGEDEEAAELAGYRLKIVRSERPHLSLGDAKENLSPSVFAKIQPFITKIKSCYIKPTFLGDLKKAA